MRILISILSLLSVSACWDQATHLNPSQPTVVAGIDVQESDREAASTVALSIIDQKSPTLLGDVFCSGTLIHPEWVLTAAHCVEGFLNWQPVPPVVAHKDDFTPEAWAIVQRDPSCIDKMNEAYNTPPPKSLYLSFGAQAQLDADKSLLNPNLDYIEIPANSRNIFIHPDYVGGLFPSPFELSRSVDLALIRIPQGKLPAHAKPASVLSSSEFSVLVRGKTPMLTVAGYGSMGTMMKLYDKPKTCEHIISMGVEFEHKAIGRLRKRAVQYIKTSNENKSIFIASTGACKGDSGGPAYLEKNGQLYLVGTVSAEYIDDADDPFTGEILSIKIVEQCTKTDTEYVAVSWQQAWLNQVMNQGGYDDADQTGEDQSFRTCSVGNLSGDPYVNVRSGPGTQYGVIDRLYNGSQVMLSAEERGSEIFDPSLGKRSSLWGKLNLASHARAYVSMLYLQCRNER